MEEFRVPLDSAAAKFVLSSFSVFDSLQAEVLDADAPPSLFAAINKASDAFKYE
jgi:hypothetical protein